MDEFLRYVVQQLVDFPEDVFLSHREEGDKIVYQLSLNKGDIGRLIGKGGGTIHAVRELLGVAAQRQGRKVSLEILE